MKPKKPFLHNISGISLIEYNELKDLFRSGESVWRWSGIYDLKLAFHAALYHREAYRKLLAIAKILGMLMRPKGIIVPALAYKTTQELRAMLEGDALYKMRDRPTGQPKVWRRNKAGWMRVFDRHLCTIISSILPNDEYVKDMIEKNELRWASKRMPGSGSMKRGKPKKRDRSHEKRPYDTLLVRIDGIVTMPLSRRDLKSYAHRKVEILKDPREVKR